MAKSKLSSISPKSLFDINPMLAKEWHPTKNGSLTPKHISYGSGEKVWWICSKGHEWEARVLSRSHGTGCPYCSGNAVSVDNCLQTVNPELSKEWHPTKNIPLTPNDVTAGANRKIWWVCKKGMSGKNKIMKDVIIPIFISCIS